MFLFVDPLSHQHFSLGRTRQREAEARQVEVLDCTPLHTTSKRDDVHGMYGKYVVATSLLAGIYCGVHTWCNWAGEVPEGVGDHIRLFFSLTFWELLLESHMHKLIILNAGCCMLYILGKVLQTLLLGPLREMEAIKVGDRIRSYALVKMVFVAAILHDHDDKEIIIWFVWLTVVGFLKQMGLLARDRLEFVTLAIHTSSVDLVKVGVLLGLVVVLNTVLVAACLAVFGCWHHCDRHTVGALILLLFECVLTYIDSVQTGMRVALHLINLSRQGHWERRGLYFFYSELTWQLLSQFLSLFHFVHVWSVHGLSVSLTDFLLFLHTRSLVHKIRAKLSSLNVFLTIDKKLPDASPELLARFSRDSCAICREELTKAKVLPCGHLFHLVCLRDWLDQSPTCPICRRPVTTATAAPQPAPQWLGLFRTAQHQQQQQAAEQPRGGTAGDLIEGVGQGDLIEGVGQGAREQGTHATHARAVWPDGREVAQRAGEAVGPTVMPQPELPPLQPGAGGDAGMRGLAWRSFHRVSHQAASALHLIVAPFVRPVGAWPIAEEVGDEVDEEGDDEPRLPPQERDPLQEHQPYHLDTHSLTAAALAHRWQSYSGGGAPSEMWGGEMLEGDMFEAVNTVLDVLPHLSRAAVQRDLALTGAVEVTLHRGLEGLIDASHGHTHELTHTDHTPSVSVTSNTHIERSSSAPPVMSAVGASGWLYFDDERLDLEDQDPDLPSQPSDLSSQPTDLSSQPSSLPLLSHLSPSATDRGALAKGRGDAGQGGGGGGGGGMDESTSLLPLCIGAAGGGEEEAGGSVGEMRALLAEAALRRIQGTQPP